ncbi:LamG-like jellyroll fold domain-containing protein [Nonomuraea sp. NPDC050786]|uniref:LamG-like jellyroll fold domain-containing protein n=1 Tax=Nonomuraea sp. NPDC050786 TaxID=3154840 RepID=UPI0033E7190B
MTTLLSGLLPVTTQVSAAKASSAAVAPVGSAPWAVEEAKRTGKRVAVSSEQAEAREVYANPNGSFTAELHTVPVRVRRGTGWVPVDATLRQRADGGVEPAATTVPVVFSGGGDQPLARLGQGRTQVELRWPGSLPKPVLSGDTATYPEVFPGVDLRMAATAQSFSQTLVVKDRAAAADPKLAELPVGLAVKGAEIRAGGVYGEKGELVLAAGASTMWDSAPSAAMRPVERLARGKDSLVLRPDRKVLTDPATTFPVQIMADYPATFTGWALLFSGGGHFWGGDTEKLAKVGYCGWSGCNGVGVARTYFQYDASFLAGKHVLTAEFNVFEDYSPSCTKKDLEAYGTDPVDSGTTWTTQPYPGGRPVHLGTQSLAHGYSATCPGSWVSFDALAAVDKGLTSNGGQTAILLKASDQDENAHDKYAWKKFRTQDKEGDKARPDLVVTYNTVPGMPSGQTVEGRTCALEPDEPRVNPYIDGDPNHGVRGPQLAAVLSDLDGTVQAEFEWYARGGARLGGVVTEPKQSGSTFTADVPSASAADGAKLSYRVRGTDGIDSGPWSPWCDVTVDRTGPDKTPKVTSVTYPECAPPDYDPCPGGGAIGFTGGFTFEAGGVADVAGFEYYLLGFQARSYVAAESGTANVLITPPEDARRDLYVRSVDRAGNVGPEYRYSFWVGSGTPPKGHWKLDGYVEPTVVDDSPNGHDATIALGPAAQWQIGRHGDALWLNGTTGYAGTGGGATVETDKTFTVSAWVKPDRLDTTTRTAVSQDGGQVSAFSLQYNPATKKWNFTMPAADSSGAERHIAESATAAVAGRWTHLLGTYDAAAKQLKIYVDGVAGTTAGHPTPWKGSGSVQLGRAQAAGGPVEHWPGSLDEVRVYDRSLTAGEIHDLAAAPATEELFLPLDDGSGSTAQDVSGNYRLGALASGASWTTGQVGTGAVRLSGGSVSTGAPAVRTDASFTVTAWVKLDAADSRTRTVLSQDAGQGSGFQLRYRGDTRKWSFALPSSASDTQLTLSADSADDAQAGEWTYLAGVYDAAAKEARLHVYVETTKTTRTTATATVNATGAFQVGQGRQNSAPATPFAGVIDDVHAWTGVRTPAQIAEERKNPVTKRSTPYAGQLGRFFNLAGRHVVTTGPVPPGSHFEFSLGMPAPADAPNTQTVYSCRNGAADYFLDLDCGTYTNLGSVGRLYTTPPAGVPTLLVHRCLIPGVGHFASVDPNCEGQTKEFPLGYTRAYSNLIRHLETGFPYDHASATERMEANYRPELGYGSLAMTQLPGTTALMSCRAGADAFTSVDPACEGSTVVGRLGYIWTSPPQNVPGAPGAVGAELFRCRASWGDLFESRDRNCENQELDRSLGFVVTGL